MEFKNTPNKCYQTEDGPKWFSRSVAVLGIVCINVNNTKYILITKRSKIMEDSPGKWCMPCGYLDWDETLTEAVEREIFEETGFECFLEGREIIDIDLNFHISSQSTVNRQNITVYSYFHYKEESLPILKLTAETEEVLWMPFNDVSKYDFAFNHEKIIINTPKIIIK